MKRAQKTMQKTKTDTATDIVNEFLAMNGRILFHYGAVSSRKFTGKNIIQESGFWYADILENDEDQISYRIPYTLIAVLGQPIEQEPGTPDKEVSNARKRNQ